MNYYSEGCQLVWNLPKYTYKVTIAGDDGLVFSVTKAPNRFHRFMQRLILGFVWEKIEQ